MNGTIQKVSELKYTAVGSLYQISAKYKEKKSWDQLPGVTKIHS